DNDHKVGLFIGFRTRVPISLQFSLDANFDPSTAREELIEDAWNEWLISQCGELLSVIALGLLKDNPAEAWKFIPISSEFIGDEKDEWLRSQFSSAFKHITDCISVDGTVNVGGQQIFLKDFVY